MVSGLQGPEQTPRGVCEHQGEDSSPPDCQQKRDQGEDPRDSDQQGNTDDSEVPGLSRARPREHSRSRCPRLGHCSEVQAPS